MPPMAHHLTVIVRRVDSFSAVGQEMFVRAVPAGEQPFVLFPSMGEYPVYDDRVYDGFDVPDQRLRAYREAISDAVPDKVVLDIGTGRDALWAVHAARAGARRVFAVEQQPAVAVQARRAVEEAGFADRITIIEGLSTRVEIPEPAEVCISEVVGNIASAEGAIATLADARRRLCTADPAWIPFRIQTWAAAVDLTPWLALHGYALAVESLPYLEQIFTSVGHPFDLRLCLGGPVGELRISTAALVESIVFDNRRETPSPDAVSAADLTVDVAGARVTGLLLWSRVAVTSRSLEIDTISADTRGWAPIYVPLSLSGIRVEHGDRLQVMFRRVTSDDGLHPDYQLTVDGLRGADLEQLSWSSHHHGGGFRRSTLHGYLFPTT